MLRVFAPEEVSGTWRRYSANGLFMNRSDGSVVHRSGHRSASYTFDYPGILVNDDKPTGHTILALGDSFTFGWLLEEQATFAYILQQWIDRSFGPDAFKILNAAAGGWGADSYAAYLEDFGHIVSPKIVLVSPFRPVRKASYEAKTAPPKEKPEGARGKSFPPLYSCSRARPAAAGKSFPPLYSCSRARPAAAGKSFPPFFSCARAPTGRGGEIITPARQPA